MFYYYNMTGFVRVNNIPIPNPAVLSREGLNKDLILVNCDTGESLSLNITGKLVQNLILEGNSPDKILSSIKERFSDVPDSVADEVNGLIEILEEGGFIGYEV